MIACEAVQAVFFDPLFQTPKIPVDAEQNMLLRDNNTVTDQREFKRHPLLYYLDSFDLETKRHIGQLIDISLGGAMIIGKTPIHPGIKIKLSIVLPTGSSNEDYLVIEAESVRSCRDINPDYWDTGLRFMNVDLSIGEAIISLIESYGF